MDENIEDKKPQSLTRLKSLNIRVPSRAYSLGKAMDKMIFKDGSRHHPTAVGKQCDCRRS